MSTHRERWERGELGTSDGKEPQAFEHPAPGPVGADGQHAQYWVLSDAERAKGFVRPIRATYVHQTCGTKTSMSRAIAETYARDPHFYGNTFCARCGAHYPVGEQGEFTWEDGSLVGT